MTLTTSIVELQESFSIDVILMKISGAYCELADAVPPLQ